MQIDFDVEKKVVFEEAWETLNRHFYDANFNGRNWLKLHDEWAPYIAGVKTSDELRRDINLLIGELNSRSEEHTSELQSHLNLVCRLLLEKKKIYVNSMLLTKRRSP